jgi:hypothetical protein
MIFGVTIQTLDRREGNGVTMLFIEANDPLAAETEARRIARSRFQCEVLVDHPLLCPGFRPTAISVDPPVASGEGSSDSVQDSNPSPFER